jgi:hypothetical protein
MRKIKFNNEKNKTIEWDYIKRSTTKTEIDAVEIIGVLKNYKKENENEIEDYIVVIKQFRPPTLNFILEFPSGI